MARKSIRSRLMRNFLLVSILPITLVLLLLNLVMSKSIKDEIIAQIESTRDLQKVVVQDYFNSYREELEYFATGKAHLDILAEFLDILKDLDAQELKPDEEQELHRYYEHFTDSLNRVADLDVDVDFWFPDDPFTRLIQYKYLLGNEDYKLPVFEEFWNIYERGAGIIAEKFDLRDIMIIEHRTGRVVFSLNRELNLGINLRQDRYRGTALARVFTATSKLPPDSSMMTDFIPSLAAGNQPMLYFGAPVYLGDEAVASFVFQINNQKFDKFLTQNYWEDAPDNLSNETYVVGADRLMRTSSRFYSLDPQEFLDLMEPRVGADVVKEIREESTTFLNLPVNTEAVDRSLLEKGRSATLVSRDYRGVKVLTSFSPILVQGVEWVIISQVDYKEVMAPMLRFNLLLLGALLVAVVLVYLLANWSSQRFLKPVDVLMKGTEEVKKDNLDVVLESVTEDEMRTLTEMFNTMVGSIRTNREELKGLYDEVSRKQQEITDSIHYALRIQQAALPSRGEIDKVFAEDFILYRPKDIVSGDFYWYHRLEDHFVLVAADCTGHGVPGSFISLLMIRFLRRAVRDEGLTAPDQILNQLRSEIKSFFEKEQPREDIKDGMDAAICTYSIREGTLSYAGAFNPLYMMRNGEVEIFKADRMAISAQEVEEDVPFSARVIQLKKGDMFYIFSDGYPDQLGGPRGKKFMIKKFRELLLEIHQKSMHEQQDILQENLDHWMEHTEQTDDILVIGFKPI